MLHYMFSISACIIYKNLLILLIDKKNYQLY